ncbi:hypothetical protein [Catellatospora sp. NPDC049133]|uniref:hypothetical protein n=1 Tax=Catellatospora sp. NPDC049133 TaxID=3155499 RepID=UPI0034004551
MKQSGLGREGGSTGIDEYLETKYVAFGVQPVAAARRPPQGAAGSGDHVRDSGPRKRPGFYPSCCRLRNHGRHGWTLGIGRIPPQLSGAGDPRNGQRARSRGQPGGSSCPRTAA